MKLITETTYNINTKSDDKNLYIEGIFSSAGKKNKNGRVYPKWILEREISKYRNSIAEKISLGELNHPDHPDVNLERAAILIEDLNWEGDNVLGKAKVLSTPCGNIARQLIEDGVKIGISSRGLGTVNENNNYVNEDYNLLCFDLVSNPSNHGSWMNGIYEGKEFANITNEKLIEEAKSEYKKKIWTVLEKLKKEIK